MLVDIDNGELLVLADENPDRRGPVCVRLLWPLATPWIAVNVVGRRRTRIGPYQLRLAPSRPSDAATFAALSAVDPRSN